MQKIDNNQGIQHQDLLFNICIEGVQDFVIYQKRKAADHVSRAEKHKQKALRLQKDLNDPQQKKQRKQARRNAQKDKMKSKIIKMNEEQLKQFIQGRRARKQQQKNKVRLAMHEGQTIMIDLVYEDNMNKKQNKSLAKQIQLILKEIKSVAYPPSLHLCSFKGSIKQQLQKMQYHHWPMFVYQQNIVEVGKKLNKKIIYLSPDAQQQLETIDQNTGYILGGLIDRSIIKNMSLIRANSLGIQAKRLPIKEYMKSRNVLNLDHIVVILSKFKECKDWKEAFDAGAPKRWKKEQCNKDIKVKYQNNENQACCCQQQQQQQLLQQKQK